MGTQTTGAKSLVKSGTGITTLTGNNSYTGTTSVNVGNLSFASGACSAALDCSVCCGAGGSGSVLPVVR
jgi:fibronectin-binding autotransporter adhesin